MNYIQADLQKDTKQPLVYCYLSNDKQPQTMSITILFSVAPKLWNEHIALSTRML